MSERHKKTSPVKWAGPSVRDGTFKNRKNGLPSLTSLRSLAI